MCKRPSETGASVCGAIDCLHECFRTLHPKVPSTQVPTYIHSSIPQSMYMVLQDGTRHRRYGIQIYTDIPRRHIYLCMLYLYFSMLMSSFRLLAHSQPCQQQNSTGPAQVLRSSGLSVRNRIVFPLKSPVSSLGRIASSTLPLLRSQTSIMAFLPVQRQTRSKSQPRNITAPCKDIRQQSGVPP